MAVGVGPGVNGGAGTGVGTEGTSTGVRTGRGSDSMGNVFGVKTAEYAAAQARRLQLPALRLYTNAAMTENLSMYAHFGFVETHRAIENGFDRVYLRWDFVDQP